MDKIDLREAQTPKDKQAKYKLTMKRNYDHYHQTQLPKIHAGSIILVRKGIQGLKAVFKGPYLVVKTAMQEGVLKTIYYKRATKH